MKNIHCAIKKKVDLINLIKVKVTSTVLEAKFIESVAPQYMKGLLTISLHFLFTSSAKDFCVCNHEHVQIFLVEAKSPF